ncbi:Hsp20/alpha crystallin family protein [Arthrobacter halodurans]|uniref:Hsp20/alpha crystallin family protein n=1 Tax=Arthrobacter halodurans TaxID=516699 RepID=A0ABV4US66_9MICC
MAGLVRRDRFDFIPEQFRKFIEGEWESPWLRVEEFEEGNEQVVRAELPGLDPEKDVEITVADNMLTIKAEREEKSEHKEKSSYRSEFRYGSMVRTVPLAAGTKQEDIRATYKDGVLEVRVRVPEQPTPTATKVPVTRG